MRVAAKPRRPTGLELRTRARGLLALLPAQWVRARCFVCRRSSPQHRASVTFVRCRVRTQVVEHAALMMARTRLRSSPQAPPLSLHHLLRLTPRNTNYLII